MPVKPRAQGDLVISIVALVLVVLLGAAAAVMGLFSLAFLDYCPPENCSVDGAVTAVGTALMIAFVVGLIGLVVTIVALVRRSLAWPFARRHPCAVRGDLRVRRCRLRSCRRWVKPRDQGTSGQRILELAGS
jgi:hypothetical protein